MADGKKLYASVPMELARDPELSPAATRVALYVWSHSADFDQSAADVAKTLQMSRATVSRALADLQRRGWFIREIVTRPGREKPTGERWHLQMTNTRFTPEFVASLGVALPDLTRPENGRVRSESGRYQSKNMAAANADLSTEWTGANDDDLSINVAGTEDDLSINVAGTCPENGQPTCPQNGQHSSTSSSARKECTTTVVQQGLPHFGDEVSRPDGLTASGDDSQDSVSHVGEWSGSERLSTKELVDGGFDDVASGEYVAGLWPDEPPDEYFDNEEAARYESVDDFEAKEPW